MTRSVSILSVILSLAVCSFSQTQAQQPIISGERAAARKELGALGLQYSKDSLVKQASGTREALRPFPSQRLINDTLPESF